ncbi:MAG TPA: flavin reductase [Ruminococcaceae bacterium]|jgi:multimeric flavodoxin WrbA|nr:flavin reductase [Oscillospiraceae bacterium]
MKYCVVYGSPRKRNTYRAVQVLKERLEALGEAEFTELFLPRDMPAPCAGCFACFEKGEEKCPHFEYVGRAERAMLEADGLIFATPVYVLEMSGQMKSFLDHFGYLFMPHRPRPGMFRKAAAVVSTTAGAGTRYAMKGIARSLSFWGVGRIYRCGVTMFAGSWDEMPQKRREKYERALRKTADRLYRSLQRKDDPSWKVKGLFFIMKYAVFHAAENPLDQGYWREQGWVGGGKPWKQSKGK